jgi:hypothetical protein
LVVYEFFVVAQKEGLFGQGDEAVAEEHDDEQDAEEVGGGCEDRGDFRPGHLGAGDEVDYQSGGQRREYHYITVHVHMSSRLLYSDLLSLPLTVNSPAPSYSCAIGNTSHVSTKFT